MEGFRWSNRFVRASTCMYIQDAQATIRLSVLTCEHENQIFTDIYVGISAFQFMSSISITT